MEHHNFQKTSEGRALSPLSDAERENIRSAARRNPNVAVLQWLPKQASLEINDRQRDSLHLIIATNPAALQTRTLRRLLRVFGKKSVTTTFEANAPQMDREGFVWGYRDEIHSWTVDTCVSIIHEKCHWELHQRGRIARLWPWSQRRFPVGAVFLAVLALALLGMLLIASLPTEQLLRLKGGWQRLVERSLTLSR